mmetsp:Transcript_16358/g.41491  ORF Transcript_16358/g.41491 Transcript_16358/m.41491 type:complete len:199 (+) Transcript_16358:963-1559(+)
MDKNEFMDFVKDCRLIDSKLAVTDVYAIFANIQHGQDEEAIASTGLELTYTEFLEGVCALAGYKYPNPYVPLDKKAEYFIREYVQPNIQSKGGLQSLDDKKSMNNVASLVMRKAKQAPRTAGSPSVGGDRRRAASPALSPTATSSPWDGSGRNHESYVAPPTVASQEGSPRAKTPPLPEVVNSDGEEHSDGHEADDEH